MMNKQLVSKLGFIDGDFATDTPCKYHCSPSCHPAQIGPEWQYGCTHKAWPQNRAGDFVPIVHCDGAVSKCEIPIKLFKNRLNGLHRRVINRQIAIRKYQKEIAEMEQLMRREATK